METLFNFYYSSKMPNGPRKDIRATIKVFTYQLKEFSRAPPANGVEMFLSYDFS